MLKHVDKRGGRVGRGSHPVEWTAELWLSRFGDWFVPVTETGCWLWNRKSESKGYGRQHANGKYLMAHRLSYELLRGPIPEGMTLDHLCRVRCCVNPDHLEIVTLRENLRRGNGRGAMNARKTHCIYGHPLVEGNLVTKPSVVGRLCLTCDRIKQRYKLFYKRLSKEADATQEC